MEILLAVVALGAAYLIGAVPFGFLIVMGVKGIDIREEGSGNIGATNVGRILGWKFFPMVFALDFLKGALPVFLVRTFLADLLRDLGLAADDWAMLAGLAAILGHVFPLYLGFRGGKGVATSAGVMAVLLPIPFAAAVTAGAVVFLGTRYVSLASITGALALAVAQVTLTWPTPLDPPDRNLTLFAAASAVLVIVRHRANLARLCQGTEPRVGGPRPTPVPPPAS